MKLTRLTGRVWLSPFEDERDRPTLGYIRGERLALAIDAGHSRGHVEEFYAALAEEGLALPDVTAMTHWHWDHTFAIHAVHGLAVAEARTQAKLLDIVEKWDREGEDWYKALDEHIAREYAAQPMTVVPAHLSFRDQMEIDLGGLTARCFHGPSPHTDDATFILLPEEGVLFLGDAISGPWPTWEADPAKRSEQIAFLETLDFHTAVGGHWPVFTKDSLLTALRDGSF